MKLILFCSSIWYSLHQPDLSQLAENGNYFHRKTKNIAISPLFLFSTTTSASYYGKILNYNVDISINQNNKIGGISNYNIKTNLSTLRNYVKHCMAKVLSKKIKPLTSLTKK